MKRRALLLGLLAAPATANELLEAIASRFRAQLAPLGTWSDLQGIGPAWTPGQVPEGWRPFSQGQWRLTYEAGWFWQGRPSFSEVTEHRGRWHRVEGSWWWIPGTRFDPAPVAWARLGRTEIAWAPLPSSGRSPEGWSAVPLRHLADELPPVRPALGNAALRRSAPPDPEEVEAAGGRQLAPVPLEELAGREDEAAWFALNSRSVFGIGTPALRLPDAAPTPGTSGPARPDDAAAMFERQRQLQLLESERLRIEERRRESNELR